MWAKIKTIIGFVVAGLMLASVTIVDPKWVTDNILMKLITLPEPVEAPPIVGNDQPLAEAVKIVSEEAVNDAIRTLSSYESRVVGYDGAEQAYEYVHQQFEAIGLEDIRTDTFPVTAPIDKGSTLTIGDRTIKIYSLWPNKSARKIRG